jgi:hypothetical protein
VQGGQLAPSEAAERGQQDQGAIARVDGVGQGVDLNGSERGPLG